jgi:soluble lytic murein transglycosylase-like protein
MAADQLTDPAPDTPAIGLRQGGERRTGDRRTKDRGTPNRRRRDRRIATLRGVVFSALALAMPHKVVQQEITAPKMLLVLASRVAGPRVAVSIDSFELGDRTHAFDHLIREAAKRYDLSPVLIRSVIRMESGFDLFAVSKAGAMGLMQLMPEVAQEYGVTDPFDARQNIMAGSWLLRDLLARHDGNLALTLASYNAGPGAVANYGNKIPPFKETQNYVKRITGWIADANTATE